MYSRLGLLLLLAAPLYPLPMTLEEAELIALEQNPQYLAITELVQKAKYGRLEAIGEFLPKVAIFSQGYKTQSILPLPGLDQPSAFLTDLTFSQNVIAPELYYNIKISSLAIDQWKKMRLGAKNDILYQTRNLYYLVALDRKKLATAKEHVELLGYLLQKMEGKHQIGEATSYQVNLARVAVANATDGYYKAESKLQTDLDELTRVVGIDPEYGAIEWSEEEIDAEKIPGLKSKIEMSRSLFEEANILKSPFFLREEEMMHRLFTRGEREEWNRSADVARPEILLAQVNQSMAREAISQKKSAYLPTLSIQAAYGGAPTPFFYQPSTKFNNQVFQYGVGFSLNWTLFDGLGRERRIQKAKADYKAASFRLEEAKQRGHTEVRKQLYQMEKAMASYLTSSANLSLAKETLMQAKSELEIGYTTIYDYLVAVDNLIRAKTSFDEGHFGLITAYYGLMHASGEGAKE